MMEEWRELYVDLRTSVADAPQLGETGVKEHVDYLRRLRDEGKLVMSGPFTDNGGGLIIFSASSKEEAIELSNNDPPVAKGVQKATVRTWSVRVRQ
jgi:uncharacterized protein YciI